jgi:hypothetical protein
MKGAKNVNIQKFLYVTRGFLHRNGSTILTVVGACGGVYAAVKAVKDTPKAMKILSEARYSKDYYTGENELTKWETIKTVTPVYILPVAIGTASIACLLGANVLSRRQQASLIGAFALIDAKFKDYRESAKRVYGEDADQRINDDIMVAKFAKRTDLPPGDGLTLFYDSMSDRFFYSTSQAVTEAESELNRQFIQNGFVDLNEFYDLLGLPETMDGNILGWSSELGMDYGYRWIDFIHREEQYGDGDVGYAIITPHFPSVLFLNDHDDDETDEYTRYEDCANQTTCIVKGG